MYFLPIWGGFEDGIQMRVVCITPFITYIKLKQYNVKKSCPGDGGFFVSETNTLALANSIELDFSPVERSESVQQNWINSGISTI